MELKKLMLYFNIYVRNLKKKKENEKQRKIYNRADVFFYFYLKYFVYGIGNVCFKELGFLVLIN